MRRTLSSIELCLIAAAALPPIAAHAQTPPVPPPPAAPATKTPPVIPPLTAERIHRTLAPGVELIQEVVPSDAPQGPLTVTALVVDPKQKGVRVEAALGYDQVWKDNPSQGRERVSALAQRHGAIAALNAGFFTFSSGHPIGLHVQDGDLVTEPALNRSALVLTDKEARIAAFAFAGEVAVNGSKFALNGLNRKPGTGTELLLFTPRFGEKTLPVPGRVEVVLELPAAGPLVPGKPLMGKVLQIGEGGSTPLRPGVVVLSGGGAAAEFLRANAIVAADLAVTARIHTVDGSPFPVAQIRHAIAGSPRILTGGRVTLRLREEGAGASFSTARHPRTAAGITRDGRLVFLTVDGRQSGLSRGISLEETANWLLKFGAVDGVNLDGGGSTTLALRGAIANSPSGGAERPVANMFIVQADDRAEAGDADRYALSSTATGPLAIGTAVQFSLSGPKPERLKRVVWGVSGGIGFVSQSGRFVAYRAGSGKVVATLPGNVAVSMPVMVLGVPKEPDLLPPGFPKPTAAAGSGQ